jgi:hypothetical protein
MAASHLLHAPHAVTLPRSLMLLLLLLLLLLLASMPQVIHPGHCTQTLRLLTNPTLLASSSWLTYQLRAVFTDELRIMSKAPSC